jgi:para-nitrobenzyl esterase
MIKEKNTQNGLNRRTMIRLAAGAAGAAGLLGAAIAQTSDPSPPAGKKQAAKAASPPSHPVVETTSGKVRGFVNRSVWVFRGIPYGETTTGENRFMPPQKPKPWAGVRNCLNYGHSCPQVGLIENDGKASNVFGEEDGFLLYRMGDWYQGEDCLRLNVCTPGPNPAGHKRVVMVYMHGGGYAYGNGNGLLSYDGENLARHHDVVVVTHNHRLNLFGYLNLAEIGGERYASSGNVGMLDNVAVLEWVRDNIENFGGDPANVMIFGQSGGGGKVSTLMGMPMAKGLFHKVGVQSGSTLRSGSAEDAGRLAAVVLEELGISKAGLEKIRTLPTSTLYAVQAPALQRLRASGSAVPGLGGWGPIVDGKLIPAHSFDPTAPAISADIPMLIGTCLNEMVTGCDNPDRDTLSEQELLKRVTEKYKEKASDIIAAYRREYPKDSPFSLWAAISAAGIRLSAITQAERKAAQGAAPAYEFIYAWRTTMLEGKPGTFHTSENTFVFDNADLCTQYSGGVPEALALSSKMGEAWASFARTGKPGHRDLPEWPGYTAEKRATMVFDNQCRIKNDPEGEGLRLIRQAGAPSFP